MHTTLDMLLSAQALAHELIQDHIHLLRVPVEAKVCNTGCVSNKSSRKEARAGSGQSEPS